MEEKSREQNEEARDEAGEEEVMSTGIRNRFQSGSRDGIRNMSLTHTKLEVLVWSKKNAYEYGEYKTFERDAAAHVIGLLRHGGCGDRLRYSLRGETCADGVFCTRIIVENATDYGIDVAPGIQQVSTGRKPKAGGR